MRTHIAVQLLLLFVSMATVLVAAEDTLRISRKEAEALFLNNNLDLIAQKLAIQQAEAQIVQAKLWPNPEFSLDEVNLWTTKNQLSSGERIPPLFGDFGRNREFTAELSQLIETGGKRRKRVAMESVGRDMASVYFGQLLRELKTQLRKAFVELSYRQSYLDILKTQRVALDQLLLSFEKQFQQGNLNRQELIRLRALRLELNQQIVESKKEVHASQKDLMVLLHLPAGYYLKAEPEEIAPTSHLNMLRLESLVASAQAGRPDGRISSLGEEWAKKKYDYEYALRKPDWTLGMNYDRGGNFLLNFLGFGVKVDVPVFNRNQGAILESKIGIEKSKVEVQQTNKIIEAEVASAFRNLQISLAAFESLDANYQLELDTVFSNYTAHFARREINLVEYLDFFDAYIANKRTLLLTRKQLLDDWEELAFVTATDL